MTVAGKVALFIIALGVFISGIVLLVDASYVTPNVWYRGELTFCSEENYREFKDYIIDPKITLDSIKVEAYNSWFQSNMTCYDVTYLIKVPRDFHFKYKYRNTWSATGETNKEAGFIIMCIFGGVGAIVSGIYVFSKEEVNEVST